MDPWAVLLELEPRVRRALRRECGDKADEAWSEVALERIHRICELYDPEKGDLGRYVVTTIRRYARKWQMRSLKFIGQETRVPRSSAEVHDDRTHDDSETHELREHADECLALLEPYDRWLIKTHLIEDYPFIEMARVAGTSKSTMRFHYENALKNAFLALRGILDT